MSMAYAEERPAAGIGGPFGEADGDQNFEPDSTPYIEEAGELRSVSIHEVIVANRFRKDLGDVRDLAESIADIGLINPITLTPEYELLAGGRRLEAHKMLGLAEVPARIVHTISDARDRLVAERDENTKRKPMLLSESAALGMAIEELERPAALARQSPGRPPKNAGPGTRDNREPRPREIAADAIGIPEATYRRVKQVIETAEDESQHEEVREAARDALTQIDSGGPIRPAVEAIKEKREEITKRGEVIPIRVSKDATNWDGMADRYPTAKQAFEAEGGAYPSFKPFFDAAMRRGVKFRFKENTYATYVAKSAEILDRTSMSIEVAVEGFDRIDLTTITPEQAAEALERIDGSRHQLNQFVKALKEITND